MRSFLFTTSFLLTLLVLSNSSFAQARIGCMDKSIRVQSEQIKRDFKAQGMEVFKDAMLNMQHKEPYPVAIQLNAQQLYQFVFVGSSTATKLYFELFDGSDKKLAEKIVENTGSHNMIVYSFIPQRTDLYLLVVSQKVKGDKQICGSLTVMQKAQGQTTQPATDQ